MATAPIIQNTRTRQEWAAVINADWRKSIDSIIQTGRDLAAAKAELPHGEFSKMVEADLPFTITTASQLMRVANDPKITKFISSETLPPSWRVLSMLTSLSEADFQKGVDSGVISPDTSLRKADAYQGAVRIPEGETWGANRKPSTLPTPDEAREIARATGRLVAASDGRTYSGATVEETKEYSDRRTQAFRALEAIEHLADIGDADAFVAGFAKHWLVDFRLSAIDDAATFLPNFKKALGVIDAE